MASAGGWFWAAATIGLAMAPIARAATVKARPIEASARSLPPSTLSRPGRWVNMAPRVPQPNSLPTIMVPPISTRAAPKNGKPASTFCTKACGTISPISTLRGVPPVSAEGVT